jgi:hypothetical protein
LVPKARPPGGAFSVYLLLQRASWLCNYFSFSLANRANPDAGI